jgi:hypothetical protein
VFDLTLQLSISSKSPKQRKGAREVPPGPAYFNYDLNAQSNGGEVPNGVNGTATFWKLSDNQTLVTLELENGATGTELSHTAHIHENSAEEGGGIVEYLSPIDGTGGGGTSARVVERSITELATFNGYINIHESLGNQGTIISQGNIGANAEGTVGEGLNLLDDPRSASYDLTPVSNNGDQAPEGIPGEVRFKELTSDQTLVTLTLNPGTDDGTPTRPCPTLRTFTTTLPRRAARLPST